MTKPVQDVHIVAPIIPFKTAYQSHDRETFTCDPVSLTHQSMSAECDVNLIMARFEKTGILEHRNTFEGQYGDFTELPQDYHESMNAVIAANDMFSTLPATVRKRFANDPGLFLDFVADPNNKTELEKMGLAKAPIVELIDADDTPPPPAPKAAPAPAPAAPPAPKSGE